MQPMYYVGLDVHKRKISYCVKDSSGKIHAEGSISATRLDLDHWMKELPQPWSATMFTGWIYDHLIIGWLASTHAYPARVGRQIRTQGLGRATNCGHLEFSCRVVCVRQSNS
jgi:hypothetical protein